MLTKQSAEKIAQEYLELGRQLALEEAGLLKLSEEMSRRARQAAVLHIDEPILKEPMRIPGSSTILRPAKTKPLKARKDGKRYTYMKGDPSKTRKKEGSLKSVRNTLRKYFKPIEYSTTAFLAPGAYQAAKNNLLSEAAQELLPNTAFGKRQLDILHMLANQNKEMYKHTPYFLLDPFNQKVSKGVLEHLSSGVEEDMFNIKNLLRTAIGKPKLKGPGLVDTATLTKVLDSFSDTASELVGN
tara:strand:+ start:466 stop:1191 length:726 start_codon:yes stop_codon:yes gene_type:complete